MPEAAESDDERHLPEIRRLPVPIDHVEVIQYEDTGWTRNGRDGMGGKRRYRFDDLRKAAYVRLIRMGVRRVAAAEAVGVAYGTVQEHFLRFPDFYEDVVNAEMARVDEVEQALFETALAGNVIAQQVILYNRRPDEWADQRMLRARMEAIAAGAEADELRAAESAKATLADKLGALRERLVPDAEPVKVTVDADGD